MVNKDRFSNRLKEVLEIAEREAINDNQSEVGTEHFLLAIYKLRKSMIFKFLDSYGLTEEVVRKHVKDFKKLSGSTNTRKVVGKSLPYSKTLQDTLEKATVSTEKFGHSGVGTPHVILEMLEDGGIANFILSVEGVSATDLKNEIINFLGDNKTPNNKSLNKGNTVYGNASSDRYKFSTPLLDSVSRDLTKVAEEGKLDPMIGRENELKRSIEILSRRTKNNPILIGEPGVGKSALVEGLALAIVKGEVPKKIQHFRLVQLDLTHLVAGTKYRGEFEDKVKKLLEEVKKAENIVLFIDEIHTMIGAGGAEGALDISNILKPALSRGEIKCIGATTLDEYKKHFEKDSALERRFQPIQLNEPTAEQAIQILQGLKSKYEDFHQVLITDEAIESAVSLSTRYIMDRQLPDKAIDLIDEACVKVSLGNLNIHDDEVLNLVSEIESLRREKQNLLKLTKFLEAAEVRKKEMAKIEELKQLNEEVAKTQSLNLTESDEETDETVEILGKVEESHIAQVVASWTSIPVTRLNEAESARLLKLEDKLHERIVGQEEAVTTLAKAVKRSRAGLQDPKKPIGSFLFLGPTGVGKTEIAKTLAEELFGDENSFIRLDMSEYMEKHSVSRLVGSPPGYVGYDEGGQLTEKVRRKPYSVVLLDEIEKAHPDVFNILLQILDDGQLTDSKGRLVNFKNTIVIMTSNLGVSELRFEKSLGFGGNSSEMKEKQNKDKILAKVKDTLKPEFINRIDSTVVFHSLEKEHLLKIIDILVVNMVKRFKLNKYDIEIDKTVYEKVLKEGTDVEYGARPLKRALQSVVEDFLSEKILEGAVVPGTKYKLSYEESNDVLKVKKSTRKTRDKELTLEK